MSANFELRAFITDSTYPQDGSTCKLLLTLAGLTAEGAQACAPAPKKALIKLVPLLDEISSKVFASNKEAVAFFESNKDCFLATEKALNGLMLPAEKSSKDFKSFGEMYEKVADELILLNQPEVEEEVEMKKFAFISRHAATPEQIKMAAEQGIEVIPVGDFDAFTVTAQQVGDFDGVCVVHPAAALRLAREFAVAVFENGQRSEDGGKLTFFAKSLHVYDLTR